MTTGVPTAVDPRADAYLANRQAMLEQLGQIGISLIFILILLFKPTGLFGAKA